MIEPPDLPRKTSENFRPKLHRSNLTRYDYVNSAHPRSLRMACLHSLVHCAFILAFVVMPTCWVFAQSTGSVSGVVQDSTGGSVPGADITARNLETNIEY